MGNIGEEDRADRIGDLAESSPVRLPRVGGEPTDDHPRSVFLREFHDLVVIEFSGLSVGGVGDDVVALPGDVKLGTMSEVSAFGEVHPHHGIPWVDERLVHGEVCRGAGEWLDVGIDLLRRIV